MTVTVKNKTPLVVPRSIQRRAGLKASDKLEFRVKGGTITITAKPPETNDEYTPEQRRIIDAQLDEALKGPFYGPFNTVDEMIAHMKGRLKKGSTASRAKRTG